MSASIPSYRPAAVERSAQKRWSDSASFKRKPRSKRRQLLCQSYFPSLAEPLHMGHCRKLVICDLIARYQRMHGFEVLQPAGWDGFATGVHLAAKTAGESPDKFVAKMRRRQHAQMQRLGLAIDWDQEVDTTAQAHQSWMQEMFVDMWRSDPALISPEKKPGVVYWDPGEQSVMPTRQLVSGRGPETGMLIEVRKVDSYEIPVAQQLSVGLLGRLERLGNWDVFVKNMQRESIGLEDGITLRFALLNPKHDDIEPLEIFTSRPDTIMGTTYLAVAAGHPLARRCADVNPQIAAFCEAATKPEHAYERIGEDKSQDGLPLGVYAINPINGDHLPVWVTNFVVASYGTGAALGVPAHDQRNFNFARRHNLPLRRVAVDDGSSANAPISAPFTGRGGTVINSGKLDATLNAIKRSMPRLDDGAGQTIKQKRQWDRGINAAVLEFLKELEVVASARTETRLRGWKVSQQEYWGCPVPLIHCKKCGTIPVPKKDLPVKLPTYRPGADSLADYPSFVRTKCPRCKDAATRDTDTLASLFSTAIALAHPDCVRSSAKGTAWLPIDYYCCGVEHATTHLLCARIMHAILRKLGKLPASAGDEPFLHLLCQGPVLNYGLPMEAAYGNAIEPGILLSQGGADLVRLYLATSVDQRHQLHWDESRLFALQGLLSFDQYLKLRAGKLERAQALRAQELLGQRDFMHLRHGLLSREELAQLALGKLRGAKLAKAKRILGAGGLNRLQHGLLSRDDARALRRGKLSPEKQEKLVGVLGKDGYLELAQKARSGRQLEGLLSKAKADKVLRYVPPEKMVKLAGFVDGDKLEQLIGLCGRLWLVLLNKKGLLKKNPGRKVEDARLSDFWGCVAAINACYTGRGGKSMLLQLHRMTGKLREVLNLLDTACDADSHKDVQLAKTAIPALLQIVHPIMPHITEQLWRMLDQPGVLAESSWPKPPRSKASPATQTYVIQENGTRRLELSLSGGDPRSPKVLATAKAALQNRAKRNGASFPRRGERLVDHKYGFARGFVVINFVTRQTRAGDK